jgi:flagellin-like hook-associated protein FlgL
MRGALRMATGRRSTRARSARHFGVAVLVVLGLVASGCGEDDAPEASSSPSACSEVMALQTSLTALTQVDPVNDGVDALKSAAATVKTDLEAALSAVSSELKPAVEEVKAAFDSLDSALKGVSSASGLGAAATEIGTAMTQLGNASTNLSTEVSDIC